MRPIGEKDLLADIEGLKKSPWFNADYLSDERRLGMKEALDMMSSIIRHSPTSDAVPVIRCRDCRHYTGKWCTIYSTKQFDANDIYKDDDDFCSQAERREK